MKKIIFVGLLILSAAVFIFSCNELKAETEKYVFHQSGELVASVPESYIAYVREGDNSVWHSWDYSAKAVKNADTGKTYDVYIYATDRNFSSLEALKNSTDLCDGETVGILSYYEGEGHGAGVYSLSTQKADGSIKTSTEGVYADLVPFDVNGESVVTPDMFGAHGKGFDDGTDSDHTAIIAAFKYGTDTVEFECEKYLQKHMIYLNRGDIVINGKGAVIENLYERFAISNDFSIQGKSKEAPIENITVKNLGMTCTEQSGKGVLYENADHTQIKISNAHNVTIDSCTLIVPPEGDEPRQVDSIWANMGISNIVIENCYISNYCDSGMGAGIWLSASDGEYGCKSAVIRNNYVEKNSCDEVFALFKGDFENVIIENNKFITKDHIYPDMISNNGIGIGVWDIETHCKNIKFTGNEVRLSLGGTAFIFSDSDNVEIADNKIYVTTNFGDQEGVNDETIIEKAIFRLPEPHLGYKVTNTKVHDNYIEVNCGDYTKNGYNLYTITESFHEGCEFYNNEFVLNCVLNRWTNKDRSRYYNNKITVNGGILDPDRLPHDDFYEVNSIIVNNGSALII